MIETTVGGVVLRPHRAVTLAVTGATCVVRVDGRAVAHGAPATVPAGALVTVGPAVTGVRSYVAFAGGIAVAPVLGSRSTDTLAWVGPPRLAAGDLLDLGPTGQLPEPPPAVVVRPREPVLRLRRGPRADWLDRTGWSRLDGASYAVAPDSDRIGLRLDRGRGWSDAAASSRARASCSVPSSCRRRGSPWCSWPTTRRRAATRSSPWSRTTTWTCAPSCDPATRCCCGLV